MVCELNLNKAAIKKAKQIKKRILVKEETLVSEKAKIIAKLLITIDLGPDFWWYSLSTLRYCYCTNLLTYNE